MGYLREWLFAVFGEHGCNDVDYDVELCLVRSGHINENVSGVESDFTVLRVDDWRHGEHCLVLVVNDGIYFRIPDDR